MNNTNQLKEQLPPWERPLFIMILTLIGGYINGYTYITRHHILANMHTANMSKLGINIALGNWQEALNHFIPIIACLLGVSFSEFVKGIVTNLKCKGDWRKYGLALESVALFCIALIPSSTANVVATNLVSFFMGYQLCLFKECLGISFSTTISTGNIRNVGQLFYKALDKKSNSSISKLVIFTILTFSFALGAIPGTLISIAIGTKSIWVCSLVILMLALWINIYENKNCLK